MDFSTIVIIILASVGIVLLILFVAAIKVIRSGGELITKGIIAPWLQGNFGKRR